METIEYDLHAPRTFAAVVDLYRPVPRLADQIDRPGPTIEFDWVPSHIDVITIEGTGSYELLREAQRIAHEQWDCGSEDDDFDRAAYEWWSHRPGPDARASDFIEWRDAMPLHVWKVNVVTVSTYRKVKP